MSGCDRLIPSVLVSALVLAPCVARSQAYENINPNPPQAAVDINGVDLASDSVTITKTLVSGGDGKRPLKFDFGFGSSQNSEYIIYQPKFGFSYSPYPDADYLQIESRGTPLGNFTFKGAQTSGLTVGWTLGPGPRAIISGTDLVTTFGDRAATINNRYVITYADGETWTYYPSADGNDPIKFIVSSRGYGIQISWTTVTTPYQGYRIPTRATFYNKTAVYCDETQLVDCATISGLSTYGSISVSNPVSGNGNASATYLGRVVGPGSYDNTKYYRLLHNMTIVPMGESGVTITFGTGTDVVNGAGGLGHNFTDILKVQSVAAPYSSISYKYVHAQGTASVPDASGLFTSTDGVNTWTYTVPSPSGVYDPPFTTSPSYGPLTRKTMGASNPLGGASSVTTLNWLGAVTSRTDELGRVWTAQYNGTDYRLVEVRNPEGDKVTFSYDNRGNPVEERRIAKPGSGLSDIVRTAAFPSSCDNFLTCNKPTWAKNGKGQQTDFTYNSDNGELSTVTSPADGSGVRPQTRYTYVQRSATILSSGGAYVAAGPPIWLLNSQSSCRASAATGNAASPCSGNDEVLTQYEYGPSTGPNNLLLRGESITADGVTRRTCYAYDINGHRISTTKPNANLAACP